MTNTWWHGHELGSPWPLLVIMMSHLIPPAGPTQVVLPVHIPFLYRQGSHIQTHVVPQRAGSKETATTIRNWIGIRAEVYKPGYLLQYKCSVDVRDSSVIYIHTNWKL